MVDNQNNKSSILTFKNFEVDTVPLRGSNLVEASAGTGKTFSIAILVLRLLLENKIRIQEILMVTFTKAAVAELEERIRAFIRDANRYIAGENISNSIIKDIVDNARLNTDDDEVKKLLKSAILNLDEISVLTIHGFCQQTLNEFAFETSQIFGTELLTETETITVEGIQKFWRKHITTIRPDLLAELTAAKISIESIYNILKGHLEGKNYIFFDKNVIYTFDSKKQSEFYADIKDLKAEIALAEEEAINYFKAHRDEIAKNCEKSSYAVDLLLPLVHNPENFIKTLIIKKDTSYAKKCFPILVEKVILLSNLQNQLTQLSKDVTNYIFSFAIQEIIPDIQNYKINNNLMSFDDMITNLHRAIDSGNNKRLISELQKKYKAVFIDEFQDTDRQQYEIFNSAFGKGSTILFYIGDPKQSIYGWRKADIYTYLEARKNVSTRYEMNTNFRSSSSVIQALNHFFLPEPNFDTFFYQDEPPRDRIDFIPVNAPSKSSVSNLYFNGHSVIPVSIIKHKNKSNIQEDLVERVMNLLTDPGYEIGGQRINPSDIGILVRAKKTGTAIKAALAEKGIPAITISEAKILESTEAIELIYILEAIIKPSISNINRALITKFVGYTADDLLNIDGEKAIQLFKNYYNLWTIDGIYATITTFITDFDTRQKLLSSQIENGERVLTNLYHLTEILFKNENRNHIGPAEVVDWLKVNTEKKDSADDEDETRIESDEDAVNIVTVHKSKGLEYKIVFVPDLDLSSKTKNDKTYGFRKRDGSYVTANKEQLTENQIEQLEIQLEQENRRMLYVALTRSKYKCFVYSTTNSEKTKMLFHFTEKIKYNSLINLNPEITINKKLKFTPATAKTQHSLKAQNFSLSHSNWSRMSYTGLAAQGEHIPRESFEHSIDDYDGFIFKELRKGVKTGNFLHFIFENLNFTQPENWTYVIDRAVKRFMPGSDDAFHTNIYRMIEHVMNAAIPIKDGKLRLNSISPHKCLHELEFDFPTGLFYPSTLEKLNNGGIFIGDKYPYQVEGMVNGKVDLFFESSGKFYILDWKSNYLGPSIDDYSADSVAQAMTDNNYHLQYLIYSLAVKKYLKSRLGVSFNFDRDFGGVIYLFVRGMRKDISSGVFYKKPDKNQMNLMSKIMNI